MRRLGKTTPFGVPGSIAEIHALRLGGVDQWVMVRGESVKNPPLILLHGGPGFSDTGFFRAFNSVLEKSFTVVYWDQRGAGKSFDQTLQRSSMTVDRFVADLDELVDWVRKRVGATKVVLLGHSWGTALGVLYAARFPEKVATYVGAAQIGDWPAAEMASWSLALAAAERNHDRRVVEKLSALGPPPHTRKKLFAERTLSLRATGQLGARSMWNAVRAMFSPESSILDLRTTMRGFEFSIDAMWPEVSRLNLLQAVPELKMPVFFFLGRKDPWVPPQASVEYFDALKAPSKKLFWFDHSGHEPFVDEPAKFNAAMVELVRPVVVSPVPVAKQ